MSSSPIPWQSITFDAVVPRQSSRLAEKKSRASAEVEDGVIQVKDEGADVKLPAQEAMSLHIASATQ